MRLVAAICLSLTTTAGATAARADIRVSSSFGARVDPIDGHRGVHRGVDMAVPTGTPVLAAADGVVRRAGRHGGYGNLVELRHRDGSITRYAHLSTILVRMGETVAQGQPIARAGATGRATGAHLHFEYRVGGVAVDPLAHLGVTPRADVPDARPAVHRSRFSAAGAGGASGDGLPDGGDVQRARDR